MELSIGVVNFNSGPRLARCIESILANVPSAPYEVVVVDNASKDGSADFLRKGCPPNVRLVDHGINYTFTGGYNLAFRESTGKVFLLLNADLLALPGSLDALVRRFDEDPKLGAIGGYTLTPAGEFERYVNEFPTPYLTYLALFVGRERAWRKEAFRRYHMDGVDFSAPREAPQPAGGCLAVRRSLFPEGRLMSPEFGVFFSDVEIARKVWDRGRRIMVFPEARFVHDHDWTRKPPSPTSLLVELDGYLGAWHYYRKYQGLGAALRWKALALARLSGRLLLVELPRAIRGREPWSVWMRRPALMWSFLVGRNVLLERQKRAASEKGVAWP